MGQHLCCPPWLPHRRRENLGKDHALMAGPQRSRSRQQTASSPAPDLRPAPRSLTLDGEALIRVGARPNLWHYLKQVWAFRHFIFYDSHTRVATSNSSDALGRVWMIMNPLLLGFAFFMVFGIILQTSRGIDHFIGYLIIGVFMFRYATSAITSGATSIVNNQNVVHAFNFPRACLPLATNFRELYANIITFVVMFVLVLALGDLPIGGAASSPMVLNWKWLFFFPVVGLLILMNVGLSLLLARAVNAYTDVKHLVSFGTRIWFYASCVFFAPSRWEEVPYAQPFLDFNPMFCALDIVRQSWLYDSFADPMRWYVLAGWAVGALLVGIVVFWQAEESYGRER